MSGQATTIRVQKAVYMAILANLRAFAPEASYTIDADGGVTIGALRFETDSAPGSLEWTVSSGISKRENAGSVTIQMGAHLVQVSVPKARVMCEILAQGIEAAISDECFFKFLTQKCDMSPGDAAAALVDLREIRQGTASVVNPS